MKKTLCVYPNLALLPEPFVEENDGMSTTDQNPSISLKEMVERYVQTGEIPPNYTGGYYDDDEIPDDELVANPQNLDLADIHEASNIINQAETLIEVSEKRKKKGKKAEVVEDEAPKGAEPSEPSTV